MRLLGTLTHQEQTRRFVDYLLTEGITTRAEEDGNEWLIWVVQEDDFERSQAEFQQFTQTPDDARYLGLEGQADEIRAEKRARANLARKNQNVVRSSGRERLGDRARRLPITFGLSAICVVVALWTFLGDDIGNRDWLTFASIQNQLDSEWDPSKFEDAAIDIRRGEVWRLVTPIFVHFGLLHLIFNLMWLNELGAQIESRKGWLKYLLLIIALAVFSNVVEVLVSQSPANFGGMSGVVYGLLGFIWMKSQYDPSDRLYVDPRTLRFMLIWFGICFLPIFSIANGAHTGGLVLGMALGYLSSQLRQSQISS